MLGFMAGFMIGGIVGITVMCLCQINGPDNDE